MSFSQCFNVNGHCFIANQMPTFTLDRTALDFPCDVSVLCPPSRVLARKEHWARDILSPLLSCWVFL